MRATLRIRSAEVYALRDDANDTFKWLDRASPNRDPGVSQLLSDPLILRYRDDPRFAAFCKKVGLPAVTDAVAMKWRGPGTDLAGASQRRSARRIHLIGRMDVITEDTTMATMYKPPHPGAVLREWLAEITVTDAAQRLGATRVALSRTLNGSGLAKALGTTPGSWYAMHGAYDLWQAQRHFHARVRPIAAREHV